MKRKHTVKFLAVAAAVLLLSSLIGACAPAAPAATPPAKSQAAPTTAAAPAAPTAAPKPAAPTAAAPAPTVSAAAAPTAAAAASAAPETIKIGIITALTGNQSRNGTATDRYTRMAIDDINAKGGVKVGGKAYRFEAVTVDDKSSGDGGRDAANRLVLSDKVKFIMGAISAPTAAAQPITEPNKVLMLSSFTLDKSLGPDFPLTFGTAAHALIRMGAIYDWFAQDYPALKRVTVIDPDEAAGRSVADQSEAKAKEKGITVVAKEFYPTGNKDFSPLVTRVLQQKPDALDLGGIGGWPSEMVALVKALNEQGFKGPMFSTSASVAPLQQIANIAEGYTAAQLVDYKSPALTSGDRDIIQRWLAKYPEADLETITICTYNGPYILAQAMEKAGTVDDTVKLAQTLAGGEWDTLWSKDIGKSKFVGLKTVGRAADLEQPVYLSGVRNGKLVTFKTLKGTMP